MTQQAAVFSKTQANTANLWKYLWRLDAVFNLLMGDLLIFAPGTVIDFMGMDSDMSVWLRGFGVFFALYGLWQLWVARTAKISKTNFLLADADMTLLGILGFAVVVFDMQLNDTGTALMIGFVGIGAWIMAGLWFFASRQAG